MSRGGTPPGTRRGPYNTDLDLSDRGAMAWMDDISCRPGFDELPALFQQAICRQCRVRTECLDYAVAMGPAVWGYAQTDYGWPVCGGLTATDIRALITLRRNAA